MLPGCGRVGHPHLLHPLVTRLSKKGSMHLYAQLSGMLANSSPIKKQKCLRFAIHAIEQELSALAVSLTHVAGPAASSSWQHMTRSFAACPQGRRALCRNGAHHNWPEHWTFLGLCRQVGLIMDQPKFKSCSTLSGTASSYARSSLLQLQTSCGWEMTGCSD